jgi:hypothetical protein
MTNRTLHRRTRPLMLNLLIGFAVSALCHGAAVGEGTPGLAVQRGLQFLQKEEFAWKETRKCAACHHAAAMMWTFNEAKAAGYSVDEKALKEVCEWAFGDMKTNSLAAEPPPRDVVNLGWVYTLLSMESAPHPSDTAFALDTNLSVSEPLNSTNENIIPAARRVLIDQIIAKQATDGSWGKPLDERVPLGGPAEDVTILCRLALLQTGESSPSAAACIEKAANWLAAHHDKTSRQGRIFRLLMNLREGKSAQDLKNVVETIIAEQNVDGGWSQTPELGSDAYATGQTLYALARAGVKGQTAAMSRGVQFLTSTQREDGSWPMHSRVNAKNLNPITGAGTAWAVLGLIRASP